MREVNEFSLGQRLAIAVGGPAIALALRALAGSWRTTVDAPPGVLPEDADGPMIYAIWHEGVVSITGHWRGYPIQGLASNSFDGALISKAMEHLGYFPLSRGSSSKGGGEALRQHLEGLKAGRHVVLTLDGPKGPPYVSKAGVLVMAERSGRPVVPVGCAARPDWRLRNWDRTQLPPPFARVSFALGEAFHVGRGEVDAKMRFLHESMKANQDRAKALLE